MPRVRRTSDGVIVHYTFVKTEVGLSPKLTDPSFPIPIQILNTARVNCNGIWGSVAIFGIFWFPNGPHRLARATLIESCDALLAIPRASDPSVYDLEVIGPSTFTTDNYTDIEEGETDVTAN